MTTTTRTLAILFACGVLTGAAAAQTASAPSLATVARKVLAEGEVLPLDPAVARLMNMPADDADLSVHQIADFEPGITRLLSVRQRRGTTHLDILIMRADATNEDVVYTATSEDGVLKKAVRIAAGVARLLPDDVAARAFDEEVAFWLWRKRTLSDAEALAEPWQGQWTAPDGAVFSAALQLKPLVGNRVEGRITWKLVLALDPAEQAKVGIPADELVRGAFDPRSRVLTIDGYDKVDPRDVIVLDKYRLLLAADGSALGGITWNHDSWSGALFLRRVRQVQ